MELKNGFGDLGKLLVVEKGLKYGNDWYFWWKMYVVEVYNNINY